MNTQYKFILFKGPTKKRLAGVYQQGATLYSVG